MTSKYILCLCILTAFLLTGCSALPQDEPVLRSPDGTVEIGEHLQVKNVNEDLVLLDNKETLAADGLYYAAWAIGEPESYENSDGEIVDLYDAQLYLLLGESKNAAEAQKNADTWFSAAKGNYEVLEEKELICNSVTYTVISYQCKADSPYEKGVSAFGTYGDCAVCIEFTCTPDFKNNTMEELETTLTDFLNGISYF